jgi:plasmid stabilization system protein ParE
MVRKANRQVHWDRKAFEDFTLILEYIKEQSPGNAQLVKRRIMTIIKTLPSNPEIFRADELKVPNDGTFRVFSKNNIRVSYKIEPSAILIARVRHSSQEPMAY